MSKGVRILINTAVAVSPPCSLQAPCSFIRSINLGIEYSFILLARGRRCCIRLRVHQPNMSIVDDFTRKFTGPTAGGRRQTNQVPHPLYTIGQIKEHIYMCRATCTVRAYSKYPHSEIENDLQTCACSLFCDHDTACRCACIVLAAPLGKPSPGHIDCSAVDAQSCNRCTADSVWGGAVSLWLG